MSGKHVTYLGRWLTRWPQRGGSQWSRNLPRAAQWLSSAPHSRTQQSWGSEEAVTYLCNASKQQSYGLDFPEFTRLKLSKCQNTKELHGMGWAWWNPRAMILEVSAEPHTPKHPLNRNTNTVPAGNWDQNSSRSTTWLKKSSSQAYGVVQPLCSAAH